MGRMRDKYMDIVEALTRILGREPTQEEIDEAIKALKARAEMEALLDEMQHELDEQYICPSEAFGMA
jgi:hypothetical protein